MSATTLRDLLCTNESPLDGQIPIIRNLITTAQNRLATAESEQDELRKKRAALWVKLDALNAEISSVTIEELETNAKAAALDEIIDACKDQIHRHSAVLAAVRRVPLEVLFEIFDWIESDAFDRTVFHKRHVPTAPWRITHVCRAWREAAQSYPKLWTNICIHGGMVDWAESDHKAPSMSVLYPLDALEAQLRLSSPASLDVQLEMLEESEYMTMLLKPLIERSHRWSRLTVTSDGDRTLWYLTGIERRLSRLEYLTIDTGHNLNTSGWPTELTELFFWADNLQTAKLTNFALTSPSPPLSLPWHQLTKLRICSPLTSLLEILSTAHNLVDCTLEIDELNETWAIPPIRCNASNRAEADHGAALQRRLLFLACSPATPIPRARGKSRGECPHLGHYISMPVGNTRAAEHRNRIRCPSVPPQSRILHYKSIR
ncbi:hypothetical protein R3P38DRAFT_502371 [Favolaschia claudopus]|uniref:F-box domain-containing protein n=1 Tax=Favolaschia claudopus TaxID=2862362 RepID=A0AAV9ZD15_9AGAR